MCNKQLQEENTNREGTREEGSNKEETKEQANAPNPDKEGAIKEAAIRKNIKFDKAVSWRMV